MLLVQIILTSQPLNLCLFVQNLALSSILLPPQEYGVLEEPFYINYVLNAYRGPVTVPADRETRMSKTMSLLPEFNLREQKHQNTHRKKQTVRLGGMLINIICTVL